MPSKTNGVKSDIGSKVKTDRFTGLNVGFGRTNPIHVFADGGRSGLVTASDHKLDGIIELSGAVFEAKDVLEEAAAAKTIGSAPAQLRSRVLAAATD